MTEPCCPCFIVNVPRTFQQGWGVSFIPIWDDDDFVSDIDSTVVEITESAVELIGGEPCVKLGPDTYVPVENFLTEVSGGHDDTHDLRDRWFATEREAREHETYTMKRYRNPQIWESFIQL